MSGQQWATWTQVGATGLCCALALSLLADSGWPLAATAWSLASCLLAVCPGVLGVLLAHRDAPPLVSVLVGGLAVALGGNAVGDALEVYQSEHPGFAADVSMTQVVSGLWVWFYVPLALLLVVFPTGRVPSPGWRWLVGGVLALGVVYPLGTAWGSPLAEQLPFLLLAMLFAAVVALLLRYRSGDADSRTQIKWLMLAAGLLPLTLLLCWVEFLLTGRADRFVVVGLVLLYLAVPVAVSVAVLRQDLYDVDRAVSRAVVYGSFSAALLLVFSGLSVLAGLVVGQSSASIAAAVTVVVAAALFPLRRRWQRAVDRRLYVRRDRVLAAVEGFRDAIDAGTEEPESLERVLREALRDQTLMVGYQVPGRHGLVRADATPVLSDSHAVPVLLHGRRIGAIVTAEPPDDLLLELADLCVLLVDVMRLRVGLGEVLREVESSRSRLLEASDAERQRLERDLHDGAQSRLVSLGMSLRLAQRHLHDGRVDVDELLNRTVKEVAGAVAELREISHGLRPSSLEGGLGPALQLLAAGSPVPVEVEFDADATSDAVATTAYYVVSEALANAVKHSGARAVRLSVVVRDGRVEVQICDDGRGGADAAGFGLSGLAARVAAQGGSLRVLSPLGRGTSIRVELPCAS